MNFILLLIIAFFVVNMLLATIVVFFERKNPASTWAWILVLLFIPVIGFIAYLIFGRETKKQRLFARKAQYDDQLYEDYINYDKKYKYIIEQQKDALSKHENITDDERLLYIYDLIYLNINAGSWLTKNNSIDVYNNGKAKFYHLLQDIQKAKKYIHMQYYIIRGDVLGAMIVNALAAKAKEGLEVKLLYDGMGCAGTPPRFFQPLLDVGGQTGVFHPPLFTRLNYRNHRKLCIIDGQIGYTGGFNIGDEYIGVDKRFGYWRDTHMRITGDAVDLLELRFMKDWNFCARDKLILSRFYYPKKEKLGHINMQVISGGPDTKWYNIHNAYFKLITEAEEKIYIETPYFVPDDSLFAALKVAALSGIDVKIIIPGNPDHPFVYWASLSYLGELLQTGVRCFQYADGFLHCKVVMVDSCVTSVGTANFDVRSFKTNFEVNSFIYDRETTKRFENKFLEDLDYSTEITLQTYNQRNRSTKLKESLSRLISPML